MSGFNKVIMLGNLTRDPNLSYLPSQTPVVEFGLAVNNRWIGKDGTKHDDVCFIDCRAFGNQADTINKYCSKGRPLLVEGRLDFDQWETPDGAKRSKHRITVNTFTFISSGESQNSNKQPRQAEADNSGPPPIDDEIPF